MTHEREVVRGEVPCPDIVGGVRVYVRGSLGLHAWPLSQPTETPLNVGEILECLYCQ